MKRGSVPTVEMTSLSDPRSTVTELLCELCLDRLLVLLRGLLLRPLLALLLLLQPVRLVFLAVRLSERGAIGLHRAADEIAVADEPLELAALARQRDPGGAQNLERLALAQDVIVERLPVLVAALEDASHERIEIRQRRGGLRLTGQHGAPALGKPAGGREGEDCGDSASVHGHLHKGRGAALPVLRRPARTCSTAADPFTSAGSPRRESRPAWRRGGRRHRP